MLIRALELRQQSLPSTAAGWRQLLHLGLPTDAGPAVNETSALTHTTVLACVLFLARNVAQLPFHLYERQANGDRKPARRHPLYPLLHDLPNERHTVFQFLLFMYASLMLRGNALAWKQLTQGGDVRALYPLRWDYVTPEIEAGQVLYIYRPPQQPESRLTSRDVWHWTGLSLDGVQGVSPIALMRQSVGWGLAMERHGNHFFGRGMTMAGALEHPGELSDIALKRLRLSLEERHAGAENAFKALILEEGMKWHAMGVTPEDAQYLESRKFNTEEIAAIYGVPPHLIGRLDKATFSNIEQQSLEFVIYHLMPWLVSIEKAVYRDLLKESERERYFAKFNVDGLLRGDARTRAEAHRIAIMSGWKNRNEVREQEEMNRGPAELDEYLAPMNMTPADELGAEPEPPAPPPSSSSPPAPDIPPPPTESNEARAAAASRRALAAAFRRTFEAMAARILRAEIRELRKRLPKHLEGELDDAGRARPPEAPVYREGRDAATLRLELDDFYAPEGEFHGYVEEQAAASLADLAAASFDLALEEIDHHPEPEALEAHIAAAAGLYAARHVMSSTRTLEAAVASAPENPGPVLEELFTDWREGRPARAALKETVYVSRQAARDAWRAGGVERIVWRTRGDTCPFCKTLDGRVVGINAPFMGKGDSIEAEGQPPLVSRRRRFVPPIHPGCDCDIQPA